MQRLRRVPEVVLSAGLIGFGLWTALFGVFPTLVQRSVHLGVGLALIFLLVPGWRRGAVGRAADGLLLVLSIAAAVFLIAEYEALPQRMGIPSTGDVVLGAVMLVVVLEACRRVASGWLSLLALLAVAYAMFGQHLPLPLGHTGVRWSRLLSYLYTTTDGILGVPLGASATYIVLFLFFGAALQATGGGDFFLDLCHALMGRVRGGSAKVAVLASAFFGSISGSAIANVATTGAITIPMMKRSGFRPEFAGAVEAVASTGGQIMPPIMGASAFIMAEILNIPYREVVLAALIPALLYYLAILILVDIEAVKSRLHGLPDTPRLGAVLRKGGVFLFPLVLLVYMLIVRGYTPLVAGAWAVLATFAVAPLNGYRRLSPSVVWQSVRSAATGTLVVMAACAAAGIIIGTVNLTTLGYKLSSFLVSVSGNNLPLLLTLTMLTSFVLGIGLPTVATYLVLATLIAPALSSLGITPLAAHLFVFYYGIFADMTPPVAVTAYTAAGFAGADPNRTGWTATWLGFVAYLMPFAFVYDPGLLLQGDASQIATAVASSLIGIVALASAIEGYWFGDLGVLERILLALGALGLVLPEPATEFAGLAAVVAVLGRRPLLARWSRGRAATRKTQTWRDNNA